MSFLRPRKSWLGLLLGSAAFISAAAVQAAEPVLQTEQSDVVTLKPYSPHTILVEDAVYTHNKDGRVDVVDADRGVLLGMVQAAYNANMVMTPAVFMWGKPHGSAVTAVRGMICWPNTMPRR